MLSVNDYKWNEDQIHNKLSHDPSYPRDGKAVERGEHFTIVEDVT